MPRRMLDPDFWDDNRIKRLSPTERLMFIGMISHADDEGRLLGDPAFLRAKIFPYDDFSLAEIKSMRDHILQVNPNLQLYENAGDSYLCFRKWSNYQKPSHPRPSKLPPPPQTPESFQNDSSAVPESFQNDSSAVPESFQNDSSAVPESFRPSIGKVSIGKVSTGSLAQAQETLTRFTVFWKAYPKKRGKGQAEKAFKKVAPDEQLLTVMLAAIERAKKSAQWLEAGGKFIPHPATWLNGRRWEDEYQEHELEARGPPGKLPTSEELERSWKK